MEEQKKTVTASLELLEDFKRDVLNMRMLIQNISSYEKDANQNRVAMLELFYKKVKEANGKLDNYFN